MAAWKRLRSATCPADSASSAALRIAARTALGAYRLTLESVREMLADMLSARGATLDADEVIDKTCERFGVARAVLLGGDRSRENVLARQTAMYLLRESAGLSYADIARLFGGKSHTTVMHAVRRTCEALAGDAAYRRRTEDLRRYFGRS